MGNNARGDKKKKTRPLDASSFWEIRPRACSPLRSTSQEVPTPPSSEIQGRVGNLHAPDEKKTSVLFCLKEQTPSSEQNSKVYRRPDACLSRLWVEIEKGNPARHRSYLWVSQEPINLESRISMATIPFAKILQRLYTPNYHTNWYFTPLLWREG